MANIFSKFLNKLTATTDELPKLQYHVAEDVIDFENNYLCSVIAFDGINFEAIGDNHLESDFDALNLAYTELTKDKAGRLAFYTYQLRRKIEVDTVYEFDNKFCRDFANKYLARFNDKDYYNNFYYLALVMKYETDLDSGIEAQLDGANMYYIGNSENHERNLNEAFQKAIEAFDEKNKDLNFILNKIQADYDKASDERFERQIEKLQALHQSKQDTKKQREVLFAVAGFVAGLVVCLLVLFIVK